MCVFLWKTVCWWVSPRRIFILSPAGFVISPVRHSQLGLIPEIFLKFEILHGESSSPHRGTERECLNNVGFRIKSVVWEQPFWLVSKLQYTDNVTGEWANIYTCMEVIIIFWFVVSTYNTNYKKKKHWLLRLKNSVTLAELLMLVHACIKEQNPRACLWRRKFCVGGDESWGRFGSIAGLFSKYLAS